MQHSNIRDLNEPVAIFAKTLSQPTIKIFKINPYNITLTDITPLNATPVNIIDNYWRYVLVTPNEVCFLYIKFGELGTILRVGYTPYVFFLISPQFEENLLIPYRHISFDGTILSSGVLNEAREGLYYKIVNLGVNDSFIEVGGTAVPIRPYLSVSNSMVSYNLEIKNYPLNIQTEKRKIFLIHQQNYKIKLEYKTSSYALRLINNNLKLFKK